MIKYLTFLSVKYNFNNILQAFHTSTARAADSHTWTEAETTVVSSSIQNSDHRHKDKHEEQIDNRYDTSQGKCPNLNRYNTFTK